MISGNGSDYPEPSPGGEDRDSGNVSPFGRKRDENGAIIAPDPEHFRHVATQYFGIAHNIARHYKVSKPTLYRWIKQDHRLAEALEESRETRDDRVEAKMIQKILQEGDSRLIEFYAKTRMKDRGFAVRTEHEHINHEPVVVKLPAGRSVLDDPED